MSRACSLPLALPVSAVYNLPLTMLADAKQPPPMLLRHLTVRSATLSGERMVSLRLTPWCAGSKRNCVQSPLAMEPVAAIAAQSTAHILTGWFRMTLLVAALLFPSAKLSHGTILIISRIIFMCFNFLPLLFRPEFALMNLPNE